MVVGPVMRPFNQYQVHGLKTSLETEKIQNTVLVLISMSVVLFLVCYITLHYIVIYGTPITIKITVQ